MAIDSLEDMRLLLRDLPLDKVTTSMTINSTAAILLLLYELVAEEQGVPSTAIGGTIQNDILKEYIARGTYIYPPRPSMRLITDIFAYCRERVPKWNTISISGYHIREAGSTAVQEIAFTLANGIAYVQAAIDAGLDVDEFAPRLSFFWNAHNNLFEEVAKFRAARRMWYRIMTERFGAKKEASKLLRFHTQTGGSTLTAQQPENNIVRVTVQAMAAVLGGTQSLHTNGFDEALGLPTERAARIALRTQQIVGYESGIVDTPDPLAGSYFVESLTDAVEAQAWEYIDAHRRHRRRGRRHRAAATRPTRSSRRPTSTPSRSTTASGSSSASTASPSRASPIPRSSRSTRSCSGARSSGSSGSGPTRDQAAVTAALADVEAAARGTQNLLPPMKVALAADATLGEVSDALRVSVRRVPPSLRRLGPQRREQDDLLDGGHAGQEHDQAVDPDAEAARRRHAVLERPEVVLVDGAGLEVAGLLRPAARPRSAGAGRSGR